MWTLTVDRVGQVFNHRAIFKDISFQVKSGQSVVISGPNGSGKSTLVRILCNLLRPSAGNVTYKNGSETLAPNDLYSSIGMVSPYLQLYNNLTALENYQFFRKIRNLPEDLNYFRKLMDRLGLKGRELDELRTYSSGMLQRMKYVCALIPEPEVLILDEPTSNLDESGCAIVYEIMEEQKKEGILILATNEPNELKFGDEIVQLAS